MSYDDISSEISYLSNSISEVSSQVEAVSAKVDDIEETLQALNDKFNEFLHTHQLTTELQLAETRIINVRQRLGREFGHYNEVRRHTTGILQAVDATLVRQETIRTATEELMIATPRYWLSPCLIALSAWINDNRALAEKAKLEAIRRDDEKTSLFFSLVCRRGNRYQASRAWLDRYLGMQDPAALPGDMVVVVDAYANGIFGPDIDGRCINRFNEWIDTLSARQGSGDRQTKQWKNALLSVSPHSLINEEAYLKKYSPTWPLLEKSLAGALLHESVYNLYSRIFSQPVRPAPGIAAAVDEILDTLISRFDQDEAALRNDERLLTLIIEENGNKGAANARFGLEKDTATDTVDFTGILINAAIHPESTGSSPACQRLAVAFSREWILRAHREITAENRASVPHQVEFTLDQWSGSTVDGSNEKELVASARSHFAQEFAREQAVLKIDPARWIAGLIGAGFLAFGLANLNIFGIILGAGGLAWGYLAFHARGKKKDIIRKKVLEREERTISIIRALLAEVVDWRRTWAKEDANAETFEKFMEGITPGQYVGCTYDTGRPVLRTEGQS